MKFIESVAYALLTSSLTLGSVRAANEKPISREVDHPDFVPFNNVDPEAGLWEQFADSDEELAKRWKPSSAKSLEGTGDEYSYVGQWAFEEPTVLSGFKGDKGLVVKSPAARHAISAKLDRTLDNKDKTLVVQYEVKLQKGLECGGAYLKLLSENEDLHAEEFSGETPYQVMFGPDKCGSTNKVHFIIRRKNPISGEYEEKHLVAPPAARLNKLSNLYTLIIHPDQQFEIRIDGHTVKAGSIIEEGVFRPSFNPPKTVYDEDDVKPDDWVEDRYIPDPEQAEKPEDWDEDAPFQIPDPEAVKPADWNDDEEPFIPDPEAIKPEDWDDEEDGEWVAPEIPNPACAAGCGVWEAPKIRNPAYKGKWVQPQIENPDYKGEWEPRQIANPNYFEDSRPSDLEPIGAVGFELWTMQNDILFDNIYIGHSVAAAEYAGNNTFLPKLFIESEEEKANAPKPLKERKQYESALEFFRDDPVGYITEVTRVFILNFFVDYKQAILNQPLVALGLATAVLSAIVAALGILVGGFALIKNGVFGSSKPTPSAVADKKAKSAVAADASDADSATTTSSATSTNAVKRKT
ncbi:calnexin [Sugiyamaella lignohabitans]|uniref:Calnexin n=1 Tax=Sugiyamaella lignohabitans TaxID=796027 RepID=A0A167CNI7_9ASCO|nr:calnexin [Sugiyamaella lignohabitans]ANB11923.1 calnexin [Sugiyamaella lignohabitans]